MPRWMRCSKSIQPLVIHVLGFSAPVDLWLIPSLVTLLHHWFICSQRPSHPHSPAISVLFQGAQASLPWLLAVLPALAVLNHFSFKSGYFLLAWHQRAPDMFGLKSNQTHISPLLFPTSTLPFFFHITVNLLKSCSRAVNNIISWMGFGCAADARKTHDGRLLEMRGRRGEHRKKNNRSTSWNITSVHIFLYIRQSNKRHDLCLPKSSSLLKHHWAEKPMTYFPFKCQR